MNKRYLLRTLLTVLLAMPVLIQIMAVFALFLLEDIALPQALAVLAFAIPFVPLGSLHAKSKNLPDGFLARYLILLLPLIYVMAVWVVAMFAANGDFSHERFWEIAFPAFLPFFLVSISVLFSGHLWLMLILPLVAYAAFVFGFALGTFRGGFFHTRHNRAAYPVLAVLCVLGAICVFQAYERSKTMLARDRTYPGFEEEISLQEYHPHTPGARLTALRQPPTLTFREDFPRLDGATAAYPVYAAAAQGLYQSDDPEEIRSIVSCSKTPYAYRRLIDDDVDMIFAARPSEAQRAAAEAEGLQLAMTPWAREAFIFFVNAANPVKNLSTEEIRKIYTGQIVRWSEVGGPNEKIIAFQRPEDSGSQTIMSNKVMNGLTMQHPLKEELVSGMGGIIRQTANYRNYSAALGYSFRYYATQMNPDAGIRLLTIDGVAPTPENIHNGTYPLTVEIYMVSARPLSENTRKLRDWFLSGQGRQLIEDVGYVAYAPAAENGAADETAALTP